MKQGKGRGSKSSLPRARQDDVLVMDVADEIVVYDQKQHRGHCLNRPAAIVWRHLDGRTSMKELVARLRKDLDGPADEDTVWLALKELDKAELLEDGFEMPASHDVSRREALKRFGIAAAGGAVLLPIVTSLVAPPVHAQVSAVGCSTPSCAGPTCPLNCACGTTSEGATVCVQPVCTQRACGASSQCQAGEVCFPNACGCGQGQCVPLAPAGFDCGQVGGNQASQWWQH